MFSPFFSGIHDVRNFHSFSIFGRCFAIYAVEQTSNFVCKVRKINADKNAQKSFGGYFVHITGYSLNKVHYNRIKISK